MWSRTYFDIVFKLRHNLHGCCKSSSYIYNNKDKSLCSCSYFINARWKSVFKRTISWNKYLSKPELLPQNPNLNHLIEPSFQGVNRLLVLAFEDDEQRTSNKRYCIPNVEIKDYNVMIDGKNVFDQPVKNDKITWKY